MHMIGWRCIKAVRIVSATRSAPPRGEGAAWSAMRRMAWCLILAATLLCGTDPTELLAQSEEHSAAGCQQQLSEAERQYRNSAFERAIGSASACLSRPNTGPAEAVRAHRILALVYIKQDRLGAARRAIVNLLGIDPGYTADRVSDPPAYVSTVSLVKRKLDLGPSAVPTRELLPVTPQPSQSLAPLEEPATLRPASTPEPSQSFFKRSNTWLTIGGIMVGSSAKSGNHAMGLGVGAVGVGAGGEFTGIGIGGLAVSGGDALEGIMIGGIGVGGGSRVDGIAFGGGGVGSGGAARGVMIGGLGVGSRKAIRGIALGGLGVGTGGDVAGLTAAGLGVGAGGHMMGLHVAGGAVLASRVSGVAAGSVVLSKEARGVLAAPVYARAGSGGLAGLSVSIFNHVNGHQRGVTIGLLNIAHTLHGVQLGAINYAGNNPLLLRILPLINLHF